MEQSEVKSDANALASILRDTANTGSIMRELSDLKSKIDVQGAETQNIKIAINEIKIDVKEIKNDYPNRREFNEAIATLNINNLRSDVETLKEFRWKLAGITSLAAAGMTFVGQLLIKYLIK